MDKMTIKRLSTVIVSGNPRNELARKTAKKAIEALKKAGIKAETHSEFLKTKESTALKDSRAGIALVFGGDGAMLHFLREAGNKKIPVLGINCGAKGSLMAARHSNIESSMLKLAGKKIETEKKTRIFGKTEAGETPLALNDIMIAPEKPAVLLRYDVFVDSAFLFRDMADAVLVSTPTGSTAYSLGTGKIFVHEKADTILIRPVNSQGHPETIIASQSSEIRIDNIDCQIPVEAIIDGQERRKINKQITIKKSEFPALFAKLEKESAQEKEHLRDAMPSAKYIYWMLRQKGSLTQKEILAETGLNWKTTKRALDFLTEHEMVSKQPLFSNRKQKLYSIK